MLIDDQKDFLECPKCGCLRHEIKKTYNIKPKFNIKSDRYWELFNENIDFVCCECKTIIKSFDNINLEPLILKKVPSSN